MGKSAKVDHKGRLKIPGCFLTPKMNLGIEFFITSENGESVRIYPLQIWEKIEKLLWRNKNSQRVLTRTKYFGRVVKMDNHGRVLIPIALRESAQMKGGVEVLAYEHYLEVWNHLRLVKMLQRNPVTAQEENVLSLAS